MSKGPETDGKLFLVDSLMIDVPWRFRGNSDVDFDDLTKSSDFQEFSNYIDIEPCWQKK